MFRVEMGLGVMTNCEADITETMEDRTSRDGVFREDFSKVLVATSDQRP
jgi:hypothetical protein